MKDKLVNENFLDTGHSILWNIIKSGKFRLLIETTNPNKVLLLNPESDYNFLFDKNRSADHGCPLHKSYHGTSSDFFSYQFNRKVDSKQGLVINIKPKTRKLFNIGSIYDELIRFKDIIEKGGYQCKFYKNIRSIGTGFNNSQDINLDVINPCVYRLSIVIKPKL